MLNIIEGRVQRPQKVVLYGTEGIGKTSLAAQTPGPLFIDTEGGTAHLNVRRLQKPETWDELISLIKEVAATPDVCKTLVLDTADWAEQMAIEYICQKFKQPGLESFGYGKGYTYLSEEFSRLLAACDEVIASGKNVVITAHARQRRVELPDETGGFDVWGLKLSKQSAPLLKEWPDDLLFLNYKTLVISDLQSAAEAISYEIEAMKIRRSDLVAEQQRVQSVIRGKLRPQIVALRRQLTEYTIALEKAKADEMVESFVEILNNELTAIYKEDDVSEYRFDVREKIVNVLQKPLEEHLTEILQLCHYDNYRGSRFDVDSCDVVVNGSDKLSQGKGFRAFLNSVMALAVQEVLNDYNLHKTNLLVMDSPILSLKEREENVGTQVTSDSMRSGLFQYMINRQEIAQIIILENDVPNLDYSTAHCIHFTKKEKDGRYGLIEGYRD